MKRKGFTLIELMIVLAVIAILAVVLVPKAGIFKSNAKNAGVTTNVNTVRAYLESKTGNNFIGNIEELKKALAGEFTGATDDDTLINPIDNTQKGYNATTEVGAITVDIDETKDFSSNKGDVVVILKSSSYIVFGIDNSGAKVDLVTIQK
ncbi:type II secretion system protein [Clostridium thermarum]|uniref:type II secretion system protein n=1 Tax=Clostridium thermarum TaxID=1716543 RepID=UPI001FAD7261|nr:type II secretion system protein [Clostridium thermarum]